jgi:cytochrome c553
MRQLIALSVLLAFAPLSRSADPEAGKAMAATVCAACHGAAGVSVDDAFPHLAGQRAAYLEAQLKAFKEGARKNPLMNAVAAQLSPAEMSNLAAFFAAQAGATPGAKSALLPNLVKSQVAFPQDYKRSFVKYHTINFPATRQVRHYFANKAALQAAKAGRDLPDGSELFVEVYAAKLDADKKPVTGPDGFYVPEKLIFYTAMARGAGLGTRHSGSAAQRRLELRRLHDRGQAAAGGQPGALPRLPQAARQRELHLHAQGAGRGRQVAPVRFGPARGAMPEFVGRRAPMPV